MPQSQLNKTTRLAVLIAGVCFFLGSSSAFASTGGGGTGLPWEASLQKIVDSFTGPITQGIIVLAIVACGFAIMWSEGTVTRRAFGVLLGGAIAAAAVSIALTLFPSGATF